MMLIILNMSLKYNVFVSIQRAFLKTFSPGVWNEKKYNF